MRTISTNRAKAKLCEIVRAATQGERTTITRRGVPVAMMVSVEDARILYPEMEKSFVAHSSTHPVASDERGTVRRCETGLEFALLSQMV